MSFWHIAFSLGLVIAAVLVQGGTAAAADDDNDGRARRFIKSFEENVRPLEIEVNRRWWDANISGKDEDYRKKEEAETRLDLKLAEPGPFAELKAIHGRPLRDPLLARQIAVLYLQYLPKQLDADLLKRMSALSNKVQQAFAVYRPTFAGKEQTDNDVRRVLRASKDSAERRAAWEASKRAGRVVEADLKRLVKLRNESARKLGFKNYHLMQLYVGEQSQEQVLRLFDELDALTRGPFHTVKAEIDAALARQCGVPVAELRPWYYHDPFFQEAPEVLARPDSALAKLDVLKLCREFYAGLGLPIDDVLARSDLYERKGKNPHAFSTDIDRAGDVRVLANVVPDKQWLSTMLHELGHSVYSSKNIPASVPYVLRTESHPLTTEGVAEMFGAFVDNADWLRAMGVKVQDAAAFAEAARKLRRSQQLVFSRWCQVMVRFEIALYENPDQDLNRLWWELVEKYQEVRRPAGRNEPDYASKLHLVLAPAYYHNYLLGELFAAQVRHAIAREVLHGADPDALGLYVGSKAVGRFMRERVFEPGRTLDWNQLTHHATGEDLSARAYAADLQGK